MVGILQDRNMPLCQKEVVKVEMKVGIVTITELENFGNRLQNYALQQVLQDIGCLVETIPNRIVYEKRRKPLYKAILRMDGFFRWIFLGDRYLLTSMEKQKNFDRFDAEYFKFSSQYSTLNYIPEDLDEKYDAFIAGSDQIWNSYFLFNYEFNFLQFAQPYKRISYAASFGADHVKAEYVEQFAKYLSEISHISVRELAGKKIVEELTGKTATVVLDPTMLLDVTRWTAMERKPVWAVGEMFILVYYLGSTQGRQAIFNQLYTEKAEYKSYQIIDIFDPNLPEQYASRPDEFLWLIHHAALVVTDSFHGTVFSILFGTPFCSPARIDSGVSMQSRFDSLFELLGIERGNMVTDIKKQGSVYSKLEEYRRTSMAYLEDALNYVGKAREGSTDGLSLKVQKNGAEQ